MSLDQTTRGILQAGRDLTLVSGNDTILTGGTIANAKRNVRVDAGRDFVMLALRDTGLADGNDLLARQADFHAGFLSTGPTTSVAISGTSPTALVAGGDMTIAAKRNVLNYGGSAVSSGSMIVAAGQDVLNDAVRSFYTLTAADGCANWACGMLGHRYKSGEFLAGSGLVVSAGRDIVNTGSQMAGAGSVLLTAARDVRNEALSSQFLIDYLERRNYIHILWWDIYVGSTIINKYQGIVQESNVVSEFGSVSAQAGRDLINIGSVWSAGGAVDLSAKNDARFDAKTEEMQNVYKSSGFYAFGYSSNKQYWNGFVNAFSDIEGASVSIAAGNDLRGIGVKLVSGGDTVLSAGRDATFDALQNAYYVRASGWSIGFVAPAFSIVAAALRGDGKAALQSYVSQNPLLAAVHNLATGNGGSFGNSLKLVTGGASLLASANYAARRPDSLGLTGSLAAQFSPLLGNALDPFALWKDGASGLTNAAKNCVTSPLSCSFLSGIALRFSTWKSEQEWTETTVSRLLVGQDLTVSAGRDIALVGGTVASVARDATLVAGRNIGLAAVADTNRSRSSSWGLTLGFQPNGVRIGADASASNANATVFSNASLVAGRDVTMVAGQDLSLIGANVSGANVTLDAGRDLLLISQQNQSTSNSWSFDVSVTIGPDGVPTGGSLAGSFSNGARTYTDTPTTIIAGDRLDAYVGRTTVLAGAGMWSKTGKLKLDTNDLVFDNYSNKDTYVAVSGGISVSLGENITHPWDGNFSAQYRNTRGLTFATLGAGDINVRARPKLDLSGLNRDVANMTRVTSSTAWSFTLPVLNLAKLVDDLTAAYHFVNTLTAQVPEDIQIRGEQAVKQYQALLLQGMSTSEAIDLMASAKGQNLLMLREAFAKKRSEGSLSPKDYLNYVNSVVNGEDVRTDPDTGELYLAGGDCATLGSMPCGVKLSQLSSLKKEQVDKIISDLIALSYDGIKGRGRVIDPVVLRAAVECAAAWMAQGGETSALAELSSVLPNDEIGSAYRAAINAAKTIAETTAVRNIRAINNSDDGKGVDFSGDLIALVSIWQSGDKAAAREAILLMEARLRSDLSGLSIAGHAAFNSVLEKLGSDAGFMRMDVIKTLEAMKEEDRIRLSRAVTAWFAGDGSWERLSDKDQKIAQDAVGSALGAMVPGMAASTAKSGTLELSPTASGNRASNVANGVRLAKWLASEEVRSIFNSDGTLTPSAISRARLIITYDDIRNPAVPEGYAKYQTDSFNTPSGKMSVHFYMNEKGSVYYDLDYKAVINRMSGAQK